MNEDHRIDQSIKNIEILLAKIEVDVRHHIKRTDILESKVQRIWYLVLLGAGAGIAEFGPGLFKLLGVFQ